MASTSEEKSESKSGNNAERNYLPETCCGPEWVTLPRGYPSLFGVVRDAIDEHYELLVELCYKTHIAYITTNNAFRKKYTMLRRVRDSGEFTADEMDTFKKLCSKTVEELSAYIQLKELQKEVIELINRTERIQKRERYGFRTPLKCVRLSNTKEILSKVCNSTPLFIPKKPNVQAPELCGAIPAGPDYVAKVGDLVAARVEYNCDWILAEVLHWHKDTKKYQLADIDDTELRGQSLMLDRTDVIPLPKYRANPQTNPEAFYPIGTDVRALYPQTTCFYKGKVIRQPGQDGFTCYSIRFDATEGNFHAVFFGINVPQHFVIRVPGEEPEEEEEEEAKKKPTTSNRSRKRTSKSSRRRRR